jgi:TonB family protein
MTDAPDDPPPEPAPAPPPEPAPEPPPAGPSEAPPRPPWRAILIGAAVVLLLGAGYAVWRTQFSAPNVEALVVEPFTPTTELISAGERVRGHEQPDGSSPVAVEFGAGVTLNVTGRVARGLGGDWYAVTWGERTVFVRTQDVTPGSGAPPVPEVRERKPEEIEEEEDELKPDPLGEDREDERVAEAPFRPTGVLGMGDVSWARAPNARDFARYYPDRALDRDVSGDVTLDCIIGGGGRLACSVSSESPVGHGFGRAAISISRQVRVNTTLPDGSSAAGRNLVFPLAFRAG